MAKVLKVNANQPPRPQWLLGSVFPGMKGSARGMTVEAFAARASVKGIDRASINNSIGEVLMACTAEQAEFLLALYGDQFYPDTATQAAAWAIAEAGLIIEMLDRGILAVMLFRATAMSAHIAVKRLYAEGAA